MLTKFHDEIYKSKEYLKIRELRLFSNSYQVFNGNYKELIKKLTKHERISLIELIHPKNGQQKQLRKHQLEITRCLHNFLASAYSLIDNTRKQTKSLGDASFQNEYNKKVEELFKNNTISIFIKELRRFTQHFKMPQVSTTISFTKRYNIEFYQETKLFITTSYLIGFDWSPKSKKIIEDNPNGVEIKVMLNEYYDLVTKFQKWYEQKQKLLLKIELSYISRQEKELKKRQTVFDLNRFFASGSTKKDEFEKMLFGHISTYFFNKITNSSGNDRANLIIRSLKNLNIKTTDYKEQIEKLNNCWP